MRFLIALALLAAWMALPVSAQAGTWSDCSGTNVVSGYTPGVSVLNRKICYTFDDATDSSAFIVAVPSAQICLNPDDTSDGAAVAQAEIRFCMDGSKPAANPEYGCVSMHDTPLTGAGGSDDTQKACIRAGPGTYYVDVTTSAGGATAVVSVVGE